MLAPTQVFSSEIWWIFKKIYFDEHLLTGASVTNSSRIENSISGGAKKTEGSAGHNFKQEIGQPTEHEIGENVGKRCYSESQAL